MDTYWTPEDGRKKEVDIAPGNAVYLEEIMRVLDIDLDFFLNEDLIPKSEEDRLPEDWCDPWIAEDVTNFLDKNCGLKDKRNPGKIVTEHHEALQFWEELINSGKLTSPFEVVHVDAHADMGQGQTCYHYICSQLLHLPIDKRSQFCKPGLNEGNYIAFALALRLISKLKYVIHPKAHDDIPAIYMKDYNPNSGIIEMKALKNLNVNQFSNWKFNVSSIEPSVPLIKIPYTEFQDNGEFDFIVLSRSPHYTPKSADALIPIVGDYIECI